MNDTWIKAIVLALIFAAVLFAAETIIRLFADRRESGKAINLRLKLIAQGRTRAETLSILRKSRGNLAAKAPPALKPLARSFDRMITAALVKMPGARFFAYLALSPFLVFLLLALIAVANGVVIDFGRFLLLATFATAVGLGIPLMILRVKATRTRRRMQEQFPVALDVFVRGLRAGHPVAAALDLLTIEMPDPIGSEFGAVVDEVTYGADLRDALAELADRWDMEDMRMFVVSLGIQSETGGNLAEILENLSQVIRERASMMMKVRALSSEGRMTAVMLSGLPVFAFTMLFVFNPVFYMDVAQDPAFIPGFLFLLLLYVIGFFTIRRMVDLKV